MRGFSVSARGLDDDGYANTLSAVATLAYDCRRPEYFTEQLYAALTLVDRGTLSASTRGAMHGEVGQTQFLPKNILLYGTDGEGNGGVNLNAKADALASTANFLRGTAGCGVRAINRASRTLPRSRGGTPRACINRQSPSSASRSMASKAGAPVIATPKPMSAGCARTSTPSSPTSR